jgi:hypothetical protein
MQKECEDTVFGGNAEVCYEMLERCKIFEKYSGSKVDNNRTTWRNYIRHIILDVMTNHCMVA